MRFESSTCRFTVDDVITRVFGLMRLDKPPVGHARACVEAILKLGALLPEDRRAHLVSLLQILDAPTLEPTPDQVRARTCLGKSLCVVATHTRAAVEIHAGIGAIFHRGEPDLLVSEIAPITGPGMDRRRDYLHSVVEAGRDQMERTFS